MSEPTRVLVTGGAGFVARHLIAELERAGHEILLTCRTTSHEREPEAAPLDDLGLAASAGHPMLTRPHVTLELPHRDAARRILEDFRPDAVIHLAAQTFLPDAEARPERTIETNVSGTASLLEALELADPERRTRFIFASSAHVYEASAEEARRGLDEACRLGPRGVYARSKLAAELVAAAICEAGAPARPLVVFRCFNHSGPGQSPRLVLSNLAAQCARIAAGHQEPVLETGNLHVRRDFCDVRDVVRAYRFAAEGLVPAGTYNVASGEAHSLREIVRAFELAGGVNIEVREAERLCRKDELEVLMGNSEKLMMASPWKPARSLAETIADLIGWWGSLLKEEKSRS